MSLPSYGVHGRTPVASPFTAGIDSAGDSAAEDDLLQRLNGHFYSGQKENLVAAGEGEYTFASGTVYRGTFSEGLFDGAGTLTFPDGARFAATWRAGQLLAGRYFFADALEYQPVNWGYCTDADRRFWSEHMHGLAFAQMPQLTDNGEDDTRAIPYATYDLADCYLDPTDNKLYHYDGTYYRDPTPEELTWAKRKARIGLDQPLQQA